ncbi:MAG: alpha/beta hydrolase [Candidatus Omnitrophota bacterium]
MNTFRASIKKEITIGRFVIPFRVYGNQGPYLICLNGVQQSMAMWHSVARRFSSSYRIVLFDLPGQGKGRVLTGDPYLSLDEQVNIVYNLIENSQFDDDITLCTASWGGIIALVFAVKYPLLVRRLILAGIGTKPNPKMIETIQKGLSIDTKNRGEIAEILIESFGQNLPEVIKKKIMSQFHNMSEENLRGFYNHGVFILSADSLSNLVDLQKIQAETFIIRGEMDTIIDSEDVCSLASKIPNCKIKIIKGAGHFLHLEREDIFDVYQDILEGRC